MGVVTRTGDDGTTGLFGGTRLGKDAPRLHAYGDVDELNGLLGLVLGLPLPETVEPQLRRLQHVLFRAGSDLATPAGTKNATRVRPEDVAEVEGWIESLEASLPPQRAFLLPGGSPAAAQLHVCRTVCRRAERWVVALARTDELGAHLPVFLNRLSDYLFVAARTCNVSAGATEEEVSYE